MPCFTSIQLVFLDIAALEKAAGALGITVSRINANRYALRSKNAQIEIRRGKEGAKFSTTPGTSYGDYQRDILEPLTLAYAKAKVKEFATKRGYTVSAGSKPGELVLTSYRG